MRRRPTLRPLLTVMFLCLLQAEGWSAPGDEDCLQEKKRLQAQEAEQCSGWSYIFNPSACFITRKALAAYGNGKCRENAAGKGTAVQPVKPAGTAAPTPPAQTAGVTSAGKELAGKTNIPLGSPAAAAASGMEIEQLRREVAALREELGQLKEELNRQKCLQR